MGSQGGPELEIQKLYYRIGEVASIAGVEPSVLRHWETEFRFLRPRRSRSGQRTYSKADVRKVLEIKHLLYEKKFTTKGAIRYLRAQGQEPLADDDPTARDNEAMKEILLELRKEITDFMATLDQDGGQA
ncbi:MAG: MerR family transcriptional regulator [Deltaproteobacteria bacterium]|nr:MerR family transcriptional regulator [Deltaproteobacteria bacterium]